MKVVITGATGNMGSALVEALGAEAEVESVLGVARRRPDWRPAKTSWVAADVAVDDLAGHFDGADAVVHLAWRFQPTHDELATWRTNVLGSMRVFEAVAAAGVGTLVHASSVGAYSPAQGPDPVDESWPTHALPTAAYGREKSYLERVLDAFELEHPGVRVVRFRPGFFFRREAASEQWRIFAGRFIPSRLVQPRLIPILPSWPGLRFQMLHTLDVADAYRLALVRPVRGAFNLAADPVVDAAALAGLLGARVVKVPARAVRAALGGAWRLRVVPSSPTLFDLALELPTMDTTRARTELGWEPARTSLEALGELLEGVRSGSGMATPPLRARGRRR